MIKKLSHGFTLIELLVVVSIIALLASIVIVSVQNAAAQARDTRRKADIKAIQTAVEQYANNNRGKYPPTTCAGDDFACDIQDIAPALEPYLKPVPNDPSKIGGHTNYQYVRGTPSVSNAYGVLVTWENNTSCIAGVNVKLATPPAFGGWWGKTSASDICYNQ